MARRILTLTSYLLRQFLLSLPGIIYILLTLVVWRLFFDPGQQTPEFDYYILVIGLFGAAAGFLVTLSVANRGNRAANYPLLVRLPSRVEHLVAVLVASLTMTCVLQGLLAVLATFNGPALKLGLLFDLPPLWLAVDLLAVALALHATDLVTSGWSRVYVYGFLAFVLFGRQLDDTALAWISNRLYDAARWIMNAGYIGPGDALNALGGWLATDGSRLVTTVFDSVFWPFRAMSSAVVSGSFSPTQALAPAMIVLYSTILFVLAADFFATKDIYFTE